MYLEHKESIDIRHVLKRGEVMMGPFFLDGYTMVQGHLTTFEFYGCFYHGCPICYNDSLLNPVTGSTYWELHYQSQYRETQLKYMGLQVIDIWGHEWKEMLATDIAVIEFLHETNFPQHLQL